MPINPVKFAADVINQFGRYLKTTFPIGDPGLAAQMDEALHHRVGGQPLLYRGPYVTLRMVLASLVCLVRGGQIGA